MSIKTGKKLGFFGALAMLIGSVIGIGIFFKSGSILRANGYNGTGALLAWIIGGILSLAAAVSFSEIGGVKTKRVSGLSAYAEKFGGTKFGYFTRFNFSFFYYGILVVVLSFFGSEIIIYMITSWIKDSKGPGVVPIYGHVLLSFGISLFVLFINYVSVHASGKIAQITTILKWIPLLLVILLGIVFATTNYHPDNLNQSGHNAFINGKPFSFAGLLAALPAVLFAYDAFLGTLSLKDKIKGGEKTLPLVVIIGLGSVIILYTLISISSILHGAGSVSGLFKQVTKGTTALVFDKLVIVFLAISTFGVINGITAAGVANVEQAVDTNTIFGAKTLKQKFGEIRGGHILHAIIHLFWSLVIYIPTLSLKSDAIIDGISNFPTLFFFAIYAVIILLYTVKRASIKAPKINNKIFLSFAWIAIVGIFWVVGLQIYYTFFMEAILDPNTNTSWGVFLAPTGITKIQSLYITFSFLAIFIALPFVNRFLTKKFENNEVIINTQV